MLKKSFFNRQAPAITLLTNGASIRDLVAAARSAQFDGADAIAIELGMLPPEEECAVSVHPNQPKRPSLATESVRVLRRCGRMSETM